MSSAKLPYARVTFLRRALLVGFLLVHSAFCVGLSRPLDAQELPDPFDPFQLPFIDDTKPFDFGDDAEKSIEELLLEATLLLDDERPLDARSKLLKVLQRDPSEYKAHLLLAGYYMVHVGHFNLALRYVKQGQNLFIQKNGPPPYPVDFIRQQHQRILYLLSQARLSLDDYAGALEVLDEFTRHGYVADWYSGSRAWILMKLGRLPEAVQEARRGVLTGGEVGRSLNMLGILLSMTGDRNGSIEVFRQAIAYEFSLGRLGQPATPLNNLGEVYEEIFNEVLAQNSYARAIALPDGCEHVLPSLNLAKLYLDELNLSAAKRTMDSFESCVAQFPLRNGEEHRALVHLARGRIAQLSGNLPEAIIHFREALAHRQWFGKIGTTQDDLRVAGNISLGQALLRLNDILSVTPYRTFSEQVSALIARAENRLEAWWLLRRARQILVEDLNNIEDLFIRHTDSMIEYPTFGEVLALFPHSSFNTRLEQEEQRDGRAVAKHFYLLYRAESLAKAGEEEAALELLADIRKRARPQFDDALLLRTLALSLSMRDPHSLHYINDANELFELSRPALRNYGLRLPVVINQTSERLASLLDQSPFLPLEGKAVQYVLGEAEVGGKIRLTLSPRSSSGGPSSRPAFQGEGDTQEDALYSLASNVFQIALN